MLYQSLTGSAILLVIAFVMAGTIKRPNLISVLGWVALLGVGVWIGHSDLVVLHLGALIVAAILTFAIFRRRGPFFPLALLATVVVYGIGCIDAYLYEARLKAKYPAVSLAERLPYPPQPGGQLSSATRTGLMQLEEWIEKQPPISYVYQEDRRRSLERLHGATREAFVNSPGFGIRRGISFPQVLNYYVRSHPEPPLVPQSTDEGPVAWSPGNPLGNLPVWLDLHRADALTDRHQQAVLDFAYPAGFGSILSNRKVIDFLPHQVRSPISLDAELTLTNVDLVGLVMHDKPTAYISKSLPSMRELRDAPTRALDHFEQAGLEQLRQGETLFVRESGEHVRMLGAIRATKQCVECHGGQRGDMIGAFSYTLTQRSK
jgi:hypothetical protein